MTDTDSTPRRANGEGTKPVKRKDGRYQTSIRYIDSNGKATRKTFTGATEKEAIAKRNAARRRIEMGVLAVDATDLVSHLVGEWITGPMLARELKFNTQRQYAQVARDFIIGSAIGRVPVGKLTASMVERWMLSELVERGVSKTRRRLCYGVLKMVLDVAVRDGLIQSNPVRLVRRPRPEAGRVQILDASQVRDLIGVLGEQSSAYNTANLTYQAMASTLARTGMRRGEMLALQWSEIDFDAATIRIDKTLSEVPGKGLIRTDVKTLRSHRTLHLTPALAAELRAHRARQNVARLASAEWQATGYVFTTAHGTPVGPGTFYQAMMRAAERAGIPDFKVHTLRHTALSAMLMRGIPLKTVSELAGHASIIITADIYGHVTEKVVADALDTLGDWLRASGE